MPMDSHGYGLYSPSHGDQAPDFGSHSNQTQQAADFSQNESHMSSYVTSGSKYMAASSTGRSMKDLEDQLTQLKKENFNLKLRIYFAEERKKILQGVDHTDELVEKIMKLQVEHQNLKTELCDKEDLIVQTAKAMESLEKGHDHKMGELKRLHDQQVKQLQSKIEQLEVDATYSKFKHDNNYCNNSQTEAVIKNYESQLTELESKLSSSSQLVSSLESDLTSSRQTITSITTRVDQLETELSRSNTRVAEVVAEAQRAEEGKRRMEDEVRLLRLEASKLERNLQGKNDEVLRVKQDVCDKVLCSKRNEDEIKTLRKQLTSQTSLVEQLSRTNRELSARVDQCEASLVQEQTRTENTARQLEEEREKLELTRRENEELRRDCEGLRETLARSRSLCQEKQEASHRPPSPSSPSQLFINIKSAPTADALDRLTADYNTLSEKHQALSESFTETCQRLEKTDTEYKKALNVIRHMVKENKKSAHALETVKQKLRTIEENKCPYEPLAGAGDAHARGQPEGSNEHDLEVYRMTFLDRDLVREEFTEKDIDLLEKQVLIEDYSKQISELTSKLETYETKGSFQSNSNAPSQNVHSKNPSNSVMGDGETTFMALQLKTKTEEIERLNTELRKRTFNLQELVNTELWEKNREIEKLMRKAEKKHSELQHLKQMLREKENHLLYLQKEMNDIHAEINGSLPGGTLAPEHRKLIDRLKTLKENIDCVSEDKEGLLTQLANLKVSLNMCDKQRHDALQACGTLNKRLQELADFLESLLSTGDLLHLSSKKRTILKHAVEASRELSRTCSDTFHLESCDMEPNCPILPDYSEINFLSESDELADVTLEKELDDGNRNKDRVIQKLRSQVHTLRGQVQQKNIEIASKTLLSGDLSACEAFSEPDLIVSKARMGGVCDQNVVSWPSSDSESAGDSSSARVSKFKGKRHARSEKSSEAIVILETRIESLAKLNEQLEMEKKMLERKLAQPSGVDQSTSVEAIHASESKQEAASTLIAEFKDQKENNKMILNKLEHLESLYTLITNKDDLVKELELYNQAKSKVSNLESELMMLHCKNSEMKEKLNVMKEEIKQYDNLNSELKQKLKDEENKNADSCKKCEELEEMRNALVNNELALKVELETSQSRCKQLEHELERSKEDYEKQSQHFDTMKLSIHMLKEEIQNLTSAVKVKTDEIIAKNTEVNELKDENDNLQSQLFNVSSDLENVKKDDTLRQKYENTKSLLEMSNQRLEMLQMEYENLKKELSDSQEKHTCDKMKLQSELDSANQSNRDLRMQFEITKNELKNSNDNAIELKSHYEILKTQLIKSNEIVDDLNSKLKQAKLDLESSSCKIDVMNSSLTETQENMNELKLNLNDEVHHAKLYRDENEKLMHKIHAMESSKRTWEKEINSLRLTLKKYRENEEIEMLKHTELVHDMTRKIDEFKHEKVQLNFEIRELKRKIEELQKEKEELARKFEDQQEKVLKQNDRALQEIQNEMRVKLDSANEKIVQKDDKLEQLEDLYKARERELRGKFSRRESELKRQLESLTLNNSEIILERARLANEKLRLQQEIREKVSASPLNVQILEQLKSQLEKRVDELEASNLELESKLSSYNQGRFSDQELTSGGEEGYPLSPRRSLCTPPPSPNRRGSANALSPQTCKLFSSLSSTKYMSLARDTASPDLGIDSDHGRVSNSETSDNPDKSNLNKLREENSQLQRMLLKTRQALENTIKQLAAANRRKCQIERDICKQLHKTQHIIRKARVNIQTSENGEGRGENDENVDPLANV